jgi:D-arabinose 5-phosphate isomerase GutQ
MTSSEQSCLAKEASYRVRIEQRRCAAKQTNDRPVSKQFPEEKEGLLRSRRACERGE